MVTDIRLTSLTLAADTFSSRAVSRTPCSAQPGHHSITDHRPLELAEHPQHTKQRLTRWRASVERMLVRVEVDVAGSQFTQQPDQITE